MLCRFTALCSFTALCKSDFQTQPTETLSIQKECQPKTIPRSSLKQHVAYVANPAGFQDAMC